MYLRSDNGGEFVTNKVTEICQTYGIIKKESAPYCPHINGVIERPSKTIKDMLKVRMCEGKVRGWLQNHSTIIVTYYMMENKDIIFSFDLILLVC